MPRPGPRPYECVRRAWHSDRHQPLRGSIIQQIFRVAHESHSSATKKNKEWQEKLPIVVLKAEEIMYSKANSEAEYMDSETLWNRVIEAIDTIIRREESTETGELLPPCVEAALNLGCVPVKASRSQRHSNPRSYLSPRSQEPCSVPPKVLVNITDEQNAHSPPLQTSGRFNLARPPSMTSPYFISASNRHSTQTNNPTTSSCNCPLSSEKFSPHGNNYSFPMENSTLLNLGSVYPLYYGTNFQLQMSQLGGCAPKSSNCIIVGTPICPLTADSGEVSFSRNLFLDTNLGNASDRTTQVDLRNSHEKAPEVECDLSLRLDLLAEPNLEKYGARNIDDTGSSSSEEVSRFSDLSDPKYKEFHFFPMMPASEPFDFGDGKLNSEDQGRGAEAAVMKRKAPVNNDMEDDQFLWLPGRIKRPG